ncbi:MAG: ATPase, T2SS/T4P/T4SS family [Gemmatimonadaceae bacterium]|nr:ATPase, T2SS/T4P/T4SS family [Gemmatimonadaceae bacterium]
MSTRTIAAAASRPSPLPSQLQSLVALHECLTADYLEQHALLPLTLEDGVLMTATWRDVDAQAIDDLALLFEAEVRLVELPEHDVRAAIRRMYGDDATTAREVIDALTSETSLTIEQEIPLDDLVHLANEAPVVKLVNLLVLEALESRASDVHLEGYADGLRVRYRIDGVLQEAPAPPPDLTAAIISRLKIMAELDIAERRVPQDGRIRLRLQDRQVDVRVSTLPTLRGESVVLRLLDTEGGRISLEQLGMAPDTLSRFADIITRPHGIVLATGPTGSGKTTTLYAAVDHIRTGREKILTVEDPVEYQLAGVPQVAVNEKVGVTFATALRALLRQDPDVMLVGEIRDGETAEIATQAALTGHLVLSTLHTNDAAGALTRLLDLGIAPYLVSSTVEAVLAQRLLRVICAECRTTRALEASERRELGVGAQDICSVSYGEGCAACRGTGFRGRLGVYELLVMSEELRQELVAGRSAAELRRLAMTHGMRTLRDDGVRLVRQGTTTVEEVLRATRG